ncbi:MAG TPA: O-unit flippase-like protein [Bacteroidales bacterium]|jgi:O-antigen/teichoic acid export membrane protein|nr:O-unit flippase-like protein [Bacteroidales bacterium]
MQITRKDVLWNYGATFLKIAVSVLLLPFVLKMLPSETVGVWSVFMTITAFSTMLDFGFGPTFSRNVSYIYSGVKALKTEGFEGVEGESISIDYSLLKGVIKAMRWFYFRMSIVLFLLLATFGTYYIRVLLKDYLGNHTEVYISWTLLLIINTYNLYTLYYDALLQGKGLIKKSKQIIIIGQTIYLILGITLILNGKGLVAIISAQASSVLIIRWLSYKSFFTKETRQKLNEVIERSRKKIIKAIYPNAIKIGLTSLGAFMVQRSAIIIGSLYLPLTDIASYGITMQLIAVLMGLGGIYTNSYLPKIAQLRVFQNNNAIKELYLNGQFVLVFSYIICGLVLLIFGEAVLTLVGSKTPILPKSLLAVAIFISFLECNHSIAGTILLSKNEVPFFKAALISGAITVILLFAFFQFSNLGIWSMILAPGIAQAAYQNWKWPIVVSTELKITLRDVFNTFNRVINLRNKTNYIN